MKDKEQLLNFFLAGQIRLSQYDYKFMANLLTMIQTTTRVTSNQAKLFDSLITKYKKQLAKNGLDEKELIELSWKTMLVESSIEYTGAVVSSLGDELIVKVPFNKSFIREMSQENDLKFAWDSAEKVYRTKFNTMNLKLAYSMLPKHFENVRYCDSIQAILTELQQYQDLIWNPTAKKVNGRLVIGACNEILGSLISDEDLDITPINLFNLTRMGIKIDPDVYDGDEKLKFAASEIYETDISCYKIIIGWLKEVGCEEVFLGRGLSPSSMVGRWKQDFVNEVEEQNMKVYIRWGTAPTTDKAVLIQHVSSISSVSFRSICKIVVIKDSRPIALAA